MQSEPTSSMLLFPVQDKSAIDFDLTYLSYVFAHLIDSLVYKNPLIRSQVKYMLLKRE